MKSDEIVVHSPEDDSVAPRSFWHVCEKKRQYQRESNLVGVPLNLLCNNT